MKPVRLSTLNRWAAVVLLAGCGSPPATDQARGNVIIADDNNYVTATGLTIPVIDTAPGTDLDICWNKIADDLLCHPLSAAADLDNVALLRLSHLSKKEVEEELAAGRLSQSQVAGYLDYHTNHTSTCVKLSQLSFFETIIDVPSEYVESPDFSYLLLFAKGTTPGAGARSMVFLNPTAGSTNTTVNAPAGCGLLRFSADLASPKPLRISAKGPWIIDWRDVTRDGQGNPVPFQKIDRLTLGFFQGMTVAEVQSRILDVELIATTLWDVALTGAKTANLSSGRDRTKGTSFGGFGGGQPGTWMLALTCSTCQSPAPIVFSILDPSGD
jgi:hypothetical protein